VARQLASLLAPHAAAPAPATVHLAELQRDRDAALADLRRLEEQLDGLRAEAVALQKVVAQARRRIAAIDVELARIARR
jgi:predicted  nucleic acid-binding Zn-ribbon protein